MIIDKCNAMKLYLLLISIIGMSLMAYGQEKNNSLYRDFDLVNFKTVNPVTTQKFYQKGYYIRNLPPKKSKQNIELIKLYRDSGKLYTRKASIIDTDYGKVFAFKVMKEAGYERVLIFADWDYHHDSLLARKDTLYFKGISDGLIELSIVYPSRNDTIKIKYGYRSTRYDFIKKINYQPALKNCMDWFPDKALDEEETYTLVKKDSVYELIQIETSRDRTAYEYKDLKEKYAGAGNSPFWLALTELSY